MDRLLFIYVSYSLLSSKMKGVAKFNGDLEQYIYGRSQANF